jgi:hypothetical protein
MIHITKDNFVWVDVTERIKKSPMLWVENELYVVYDDDSESLLESVDEVLEAIRLELRVCIEGGHLPSKYTPQKNWWAKAKKVVKDGYVYVRWSDVDSQYLNNY